MKRILFCAGVLALAASCTESEFDSASVQNAQTKGITFQAVEGNDAATRGGFTPDGTSYLPFWYAEKDKIDVWGTAVSNNTGNDFDDANKAIYKATQSARLGVFTGLDESNVLDFAVGVNAKNPSKFFAVYPTELDVTYTADVFTVGLSKSNATLDLSVQKQNDLMGDGVYDNVVRYSVTQAYPENSYDAVGEKINLNFQRVLSGMIFSTLNVDQYTEGTTSIFGNLKKITFKTLGTKADGSDNTNAAKLTLGDGAKFTVNVENMEKPVFELTDDKANAVNEITLSLGDPNGLSWNDAARAFMVIAPVDCSKQYVQATYEFANITLEDIARKPSREWTSGNFYNYESLNINDFNYLVTKGNSGGTERVLIINKGKLSDILNDEGTAVKWNSQEIVFANFEEIICNVDLSDADLALLNKFTALKKIKLAENTTILAGTFKDLASLESVNLPKVTTVEKGAFDGVTGLATVLMPSYKFADDKINAEILNKTSLVTLDMSSVDQMSAAFPAKGLSLSDYKNLTTVTVKEGLLVGASSFSGCEKLTTINGAIKFGEGAASAFKNCKELVTINIQNDIIPADAFNGCEALKNILKDGKQVQPTSVGSQAFMGCKVLEVMDLSLATELGEEAFKDCAKLYGIKVPAEDNKEIMYVGAADLPKGLFENCTALKYVYFMNATEFSKDILKGCKGGAELQEIKFKEPFSIKSGVTYTPTTFGTDTEKVKLFISPGQGTQTFDNNTLILASDVKINFLSITKE